LPTEKIGRDFMPAFMLPNREQLILLTQIDLATVAPVGSAVYIIDELVESLDTSSIEACYDVQSDTGRPPFHPKTLIKVALLAIQTCRFSLRKIQEDTGTNLAYKWLTGDRNVDHSTMGYFLVRFRLEIVELFTQVVTLCKERDLLDFDLLAIDSMKLRASANYKQSKTLEGIEKEEEKIKERVREILDTAQDGRGAEEEEIAVLARRTEKLREAKEVLEQRVKEKGREASEKEKELLEKEKVNITDPEAHIMQQANGEKNPAFSITTAVDVANDIVTHFQVNEADNDPAALPEAIEGSRENTGEKHEEVEADAGFASMENYEQLEEDGQEALIPDRRMKVEESGSGVKGDYDRGKFAYIKGKDIYLCPLGRVLSNTGTVQQNGRSYQRYENAAACAGCAMREKCTRGSHRRVYRDENEAVRERMRGKLEKKRGRKRYNRRAHAAESPYGHVKGNLKIRAVMRRGREKVRMEMALLFMLFNGLKLATAGRGD
jgi:transposase